MTEQESRVNALLSGPLSRREVLRGGLIASSAAFLAACGAATTSSAPAESAAPATAAPASDAPATEAPTAAPVSYAGVTLQAHTGGYSIPAYQLGLDAW
jgi:hypothetical protein